MSENSNCSLCPSQCENVFSRVVVSRLLVGGTVVFWELQETFEDARPYVFQLQVGTVDNPDADDWEDVGLSVTDTFVAVDDVQRLFGKTSWLFYRVRAQTTRGTYYSPPTGLDGTLDRRSWRLASMQLRSEIQYMRMGDGELGYILKKRVAGPRCPHCLDPQTLEITQPFCGFCFGVGRLCGYFAPISCVWAEMTLKSQHLTIDAEGGRGTIGDITVSARIANPWGLSEGDVFVNKTTDDRYFVHSVRSVSEYRGVPVVSSVELRLASFSDPLYSIVIPDQLETLMQMVQNG
jgi:hypothetical protein